MLRSLGELTTFTFLTATSKNVFVNQIRGRRRTLSLPPWVPPTYDNTIEFLAPENEKLLEEICNLEKSGTIVRSSVPLPIANNTNKDEKKEWTVDSRRVGLLGTKIGMFPQWLNDGTRVLCTLLHFQENHVISAVNPEEWFKKSLVGKRKAFNRYGPMWNVTVGAINADPRKFTSQYRRMFDSVSVPCKSKIGSFMVTEDAVVTPGTKLDVRHFNVGQYITATGKTIDWGFQGVVHRWGMKGMRARGTTKAHRRVGSIGSTGDAKVWPGKRLPGHMGYEWRTQSGLLVLRINPEEQVMYIKGCVPGEIGDVLLIKDCLQPLKRSSDVPFPTYYETINEEEEENENLLPCVKDMYHEKVFRMNQPSIIFKDEDGVKSAVRDRTKAKIAKIKK
uniref:Large ribosomal subunit protein uL3m n=1 Tax=Strongyloides stercoralis TaxID=6248 RepID=A0A0K0EKY4_STRER